MKLSQKISLTAQGFCQKMPSQTFMQFLNHSRKEFLKLFFIECKLEVLLIFHFNYHKSDLSNFTRFFFFKAEDRKSLWNELNFLWEKKIVKDNKELQINYYLRETWLKNYNRGIIYVWKISRNYLQKFSNDFIVLHAMLFIECY